MFNMLKILKYVEMLDVCTSDTFRSIAVSLSALLYIKKKMQSTDFCIFLSASSDLQVALDESVC